MRSRVPLGGPLEHLGADAVAQQVGVGAGIDPAVAGARRRWPDSPGCRPWRRPACPTAVAASRPRPEAATVISATSATASPASRRRRSAVVTGRPALRGRLASPARTAPSMKPAQYVDVSVPAQWTRWNGVRIVSPNAVSAPGTCTATGPPVVQGSWVQSCSVYSIGLSASGPEQLRESLEDRLAPLGERHVAVRVPVGAADERQQHADGAVGGLLSKQTRTAPLSERPIAGQALVAPERLRVDRVALHQRTHRHALEQLLTARRELRGPVDAQDHRRRARDDDPLGAHGVRGRW